MWLFRGKFTAEQGALISRALKAAMDQMFHESEDEPADVSADMLIRFASVTTPSCVCVVKRGAAQGNTVKD